MFGFVILLRDVWNPLATFNSSIHRHSLYSKCVNVLAVLGKLWFYFGSIWWTFNICRPFDVSFNESRGDWSLGANIFEFWNLKINDSVLWCENAFTKLQKMVFHINPAILSKSLNFECEMWMRFASNWWLTIFFRINFLHALLNKITLNIHSHNVNGKDFLDFRHLQMVNFEP